MSLDKKILEHFEGKVVRKDLTKLVKGKALTCDIAMKSKINKCLSGKLFKIKNIFEKFH